MSGFGRRSMKKQTPARLAPAGVLESVVIVLTYFLPALVGALCTTRTTRTIRTTLFTRTTDTAPTLMTSAAVAIASAMSSEMAWASKESMVKSN